MKYYKSETEFNCGIDLHGREMYMCLMDREGLCAAGDRVVDLPGEVLLVGELLEEQHTVGRVRRRARR